MPTIRCEGCGGNLGSCFINTDAPWNSSRRASCPTPTYQQNMDLQASIIADPEPSSLINPHNVAIALANVEHSIVRRSNGRKHKIHKRR
ncbi:hypothetical protein A2141_02175 [Candidatus Woesebacteria bacterium RBG_16_40_11]|nr:MAG: hypothetical protein A2141_02175 [Candidatus Woesebacteria bacterium RBG_16_40_11]